MERWKLIKRLVDSKLNKPEYKSFQMCLDVGVYTEKKLKEYFKLTYKKSGCIEFQKI